ncbi:MAG: hypothetical protein ABW019_01590 [Chitinophagaceae bacterium]
MNKIILLLVLVAAMACNRKPFVSHKVKLEKAGDDCGQLQPYFRLNSNFGGERYEFEKCLPAGFNADHVISVRKGDTVVVRFDDAAGAAATTLYRVALDIDSYPRYHFLTIDADTYTIVPSEK